MASTMARRAIWRSTRMLSTSSRRGMTQEIRSDRHQRDQQSEHILKKETKRNPELMILGGIMALAFSGAGLYFGSSPTASTSEESIPIQGMPWETGSTEGKYRYHPQGDRGAPPKDAPSAVNVVVIPDVTLPKHLHDRFNKWGKDGF